MRMLHGPFYELLFVYSSWGTRASNPCVSTVFWCMTMPSLGKRSRHQRIYNREVKEPDEEAAGCTGIS